MVTSAMTLFTYCLCNYKSDIWAQAQWHCSHIAHY